MSQREGAPASLGLEQIEAEQRAARTAEGERGFISRKVMGVIALAGVAAAAIGGVYALGRSAGREGGNESPQAAAQAQCGDVEGITGMQADYDGYKISSGDNINLGPSSPGSAELNIEDYVPTPNLTVDGDKSVAPTLAMLKTLLSNKAVDGNGGFTDAGVGNVEKRANDLLGHYSNDGEVDVDLIQKDCDIVKSELKERFDIKEKALQSGVRYVEYILKEGENGKVTYETRVFPAKEDVAGLVDNEPNSSLVITRGKDGDGNYDGSVRVFAKYTKSQGSAQDKHQKDKKVVKKTFVNKQGQKVTVTINPSTGEQVPAASADSGSDDDDRSGSGRDNGRGNNGGSGNGDGPGKRKPGKVGESGGGCGASGCGTGDQGCGSCGSGGGTPPTGGGTPPTGGGTPPTGGGTPPTGGGGEEPPTGGGGEEPPTGGDDGGDNGKGADPGLPGGAPN